MEEMKYNQTEPEGFNTDRQTMVEIKRHLK